MSENVIIALLSFASAFVGSFITASLKEKSDMHKNKVDQELAYAQHMPELLETLENTRRDRDKLSDEVIELRAKVSEQSSLIKEQGETIAELKNKLDQFLNKQEGR
ncbi:hypothetical protein M8332_06950 (plasmid) [Fructilactobacillus ixorae]|uniref:Holin n=1 Tax=Fructilactobacillus ixorae TaxID=1750535 RepID=A0ABY5C7L6_9LACO|nr:hypothetical protein [Fructilactobacillus ixorae]USS94019.1 hypothetical protein M8332_06950 [Fructilactobacillus ixorae]